MGIANVKFLATSGITLAVVIGGVNAARSGSNQLPTCTGWSNCNAEQHQLCTFEKRSPVSGPTVVADLTDGVSSDGRGPYIEGRDGVRSSVVALGFAGFAMGELVDSIQRPRMLTVNLDHPVPGGGGAPLGIISDGNDNGLHTQWQRIGDRPRSFLDIPVGQTVAAAQINVLFHIKGRFHILQMGPQAFGHCHWKTNPVNGAGTSEGTIFRPSETKWAIDLPAGSVGRLFDLHNTTQYAADKGLYYVHLHYEIGN